MTGWNEGGHDIGDDDVWDDDDDDEFLRSTQLVELYEQEQLQQYKNQNAGQGSSEPTMTPNLAAQAFNLRRENLHHSKESDPDQLHVSGPTLSNDDVVSQVQSLSKLLAAEKSKNLILSNQLTVAQGESETLRRKVEAVKHEQQEGLVSRLKKERDEKLKYEEEKQNLQKQIKVLQTELRVASNNVSSLKTKAAMNRSIGGAHSQHQTTITSPSTPRTSLTLPAKHKSDPNLHTPAQQRSLNVDQAVTHQFVYDESNQPEVSVAKKHIGIEVDTNMMEQEVCDSLLFSGVAGDDGFNITNLKQIGSLKHISVRKEIFQKIQQLVQLDFQYKVKHILHTIVSKAPEEIMARFTRGIEIKTCFPDFIENMFLYGVQVQQRKESGIKDENIQEKYPKLLACSNSGIFNTTGLDKSLETYFVYDSAWLALGEVKKQVQLLLSTLSDGNRFKLYELPNLLALWETLAWTSILWKFVLFEEQFESIVERHGKELWIDELKGWTGLILKIDWRDYYVPELEKLVRGYSLSILEIIVTTGYFDSSQRRYEILYCVLKDTLLKDHIRNEQFLRKCLNIISWSMQDNRNILNYLCINNNDTNCLARILGDNVLKCFKELKSSYRATSLLLCYLHLLETLMVKRPPNCFSKIARTTKPSYMSDCSDSENDDEHDDNRNAGDDVMEDNKMEVDFMSTQFACSEKYKFEDGSGERAKRFNNVTAASCWINPVEWEIPINETQGEQQRCQCRKILLGSAFVMLYQVVKWWKAAFVSSEREIEQRRDTDEVALQRLKEAEPEDKQTKTHWSVSVQNLSTKLQSLQKLMMEASVDSELNDGGVDGNNDQVLEQTWNEILARWIPPDTLSLEAGVLAEKRFPETVFDLAVRNGILLMNFCNLHSENIALAAGSEAFNCFTLLIAEIRTFQKHPSITEVERRFLIEIIKSGEDESEMENGTVDSTTYADTEDEDEYDGNNSCVLVLNEENSDFSVDDFPEVPKRRFVEAEFEKAFQALEREMSYPN